MPLFRSSLSGSQGHGASVPYERQAHSYVIHILIITRATHTINRLENYKIPPILSCDWIDTRFTYTNHRLLILIKRKIIYSKFSAGRCLGHKTSNGMRFARAKFSATNQSAVTPEYNT